MCLRMNFIDQKQEKYGKFCVGDKKLKWKKIKWKILFSR